MRLRLLPLWIGLLGLWGCGAVLVAGAAAGMVVYDNRSMQTIREDGTIAHEAKKKIHAIAAGNNAHINVVSFNQVILLTGQVPSESFKQEVMAQVAGIAKVQKVYNQLTIAPPLGMAEKSLDSLLTSEIRGQLVATKGLKSGSIRIVTENRVVYLLGRVTHQQADIAVDVARRTHDVRQVVKMFQYL